MLQQKQVLSQIASLSFLIFPTPPLRQYAPDGVHYVGQRSSSEIPAGGEKAKNGSDAHRHLTADSGGALYSKAAVGTGDMGDHVETVLCKEGDLKNGE